MSHPEYPPISDYGLIGDCHSTALVSRSGSIDWACLPRMDSPSVFGRLLDWKRGGFCSIHPSSEAHTTRRYLPGTLVLETDFQTGDGRVRVTDCFTMKRGGARNPYQQLLRIVDGLEGCVTIDVEVVARFLYGSVRPLVRKIDPTLHTVLGSDCGLVLSSDINLEVRNRHDLHGQCEICKGDRRRLSIIFQLPEKIDDLNFHESTLKDCDSRLTATIEWWHRWRHGRTERAPDSVIRSAIVLKALTNAPTGAIMAAPTTSLPEQMGGGRNWDYRFSWIRDSWLMLRALSELGFSAEAEGFNRFVERSASGSGEELQVLYGLGGERDLYERKLNHLEGYRGSRPVRIGNRAYRQNQHDMYGALLETAWLTHGDRGKLNDEYWTFLVDVVEKAVRIWRKPDRGIWEVRGKPRHFVFSKAMCWTALHRGIQLAQSLHRDAPLERWKSVGDEIRLEVLQLGYSKEIGAFTQSYEDAEMDSSVLLLPMIGFIDYRDYKMMSTVDAVIRELGQEGLLRRYRNEDGLEGNEGAFLSCTFWLAECLARQGRMELARDYFNRAADASNDLGLYSEEYDPLNKIPLGNFPQALTHLSHISAALACRGSEPIQEEL